MHHRGNRAPLSFVKRVDASFIEHAKSAGSLYRKKPIAIRAIQLTEPMEVETLEGVMTGKEGDYMIIGARGETYFVDQSIFHETYERVGE